MYSDNNKIEQKEEENENDINNIQNTTENLKESIKEPKNNSILQPSKDISDTVVTLILDKIISNIIVEKRIKDAYSHLPGYCFNYIHKLTSTFLKNNFLFHENGIDNISNQNNLIFYDKIPMNKVNNWDSIKEPPLPVLDKHIPGKIKVIKLSKKEELDYINKDKKDENNNNISDINSMQINSKDEMEEIKSLKESIEKINMKNIIKKKKYKIKKTFGEIVREKELRLKELDKINKINKNNDKYKYKEKENKNKKENNNGEEEDKNEFVLEMTSQDLKNIDMTCNFYNNNEENNLLRKERELLLIEKEKERIKEEQRKKKQKKKKFKIQLNKNFESNILTFDSNGQIIRKRLPDISTIKEDLRKPKLFIKENKNTIPAEKRKSILKPIKPKINLNKSKKELIIYNPNDKIKALDFENKIKNNTEIKISGNNFELVEPSVGVVISNENFNQKKDGGFDYLKKYNKPSMNEYSKLSINSINNGNILSSYSNNDNINNYKNKEEQNYIGFKQEFDENNPLFQDVYQIPSLNETKNNNKEIENSLNSYNLNPLKNSKKVLKIDSYNHKLKNSYDLIKMNSNRYKSYNSIKLNEGVNDNLKNILFNDNDEININKKYNSIDNESFSYLRKNNSILKNRNNMIKRRELPIISENNGKKDRLEEYIDINKINKFNFRIIKNKKWGNDIDSDPLFSNRNKILNLNYLNTDANIKSNINLKINKFRKSNLNKNNINKKKKNNFKIYLKSSINYFN